MPWLNPCTVPFLIVTVWLVDASTPTRCRPVGVVRTGVLSLWPAKSSVTLLALMTMP